MIPVLQSEVTTAMSSQNIVGTVQRSDPEQAPLPLRSPSLELTITLERVPRTKNGPPGGRVLRPPSDLNVLEPLLYLSSPWSLIVFATPSTRPE